MKLLPFFLLAIVECIGQFSPPRVSPRARLVQEIGYTRITVDYSTPSARGRALFGKDSLGHPALVPYGRIWRMGANESTKITIDKKVCVKGEDLPPGTYALYAFPEMEVWEIAFHTDTTHWGDGRTKYDPKKDLFRVTIEPEQVSNYQENFHFYWDSITHNGGNLNFSWGNLKGSIPIETNTKNQVSREIDSLLQAHPTSQTYYEIGRYYYEQNSDIPKALILLDKAIEEGGDTYYFHRVRALVLAELNRFEEAITAAKISLKLAQSLGKDEFVRMNQKSILEWEGIPRH